MKAAQKKQVFGRVIRAANEDQRKIIDVYEAQIGNVEPSS
jgi:hypothetical protein